MKKTMNFSRIGVLVFLHITFCVYSLVSVFSKLAAVQAGMNMHFLIYYGGVLFLLAVYAILWQQSLKRMTLITAYANKSVTVIWGLLWGKILFKESITGFQILGAIIIVAGVCIMASQSEAEA